MRRLFVSRLPIAVALLGAILAAGGFVVAQMESKGGAIAGCAHKNSGDLRLIDPAAESCRSNEVPVALQEAGSKAADSDLLDGRDASDFLGRADTAADSDQLDGLDSSALLLACPAGMSEFRELCYDADQRAGDWFAGYYECLNRNLRLPDSGEAGELARAIFVVGGGFHVNETFWTSDVTSQDHGMTGEITAPNFFGLAERPWTTAAGYRCVGDRAQMGAAAAGIAAAASEPLLQIEPVR